MLGHTGPWRHNPKGPREVSFGVIGGEGRVRSGEPQGSLAQSHPGVTGKGRGRTAEGVGLAEKILIGGAQWHWGDPVQCASGVAWTLADVLPWEGAWGWVGVGVPQPSEFYLFLGLSQFVLSGFF